VSGKRPGWDPGTRVAVAVLAAGIIAPAIGFALRWHRVSKDPQLLSYLVAAATLSAVGVFLFRTGLAPVADDFEFYDAMRSRAGAFALVIGGGALAAIPIVWLVVWLVLAS
jgi:hypothetical protein